MTTRIDEIYRLHATVCKALSDPKRLLILDTLRHGERSVGEICEQLDLPQTNVSQHLSVLRGKGLVRSRRDAQWVYYSLVSTKMTEALDLLLGVLEDADPRAGDLDPAASIS
jgi:ArsR family transcriptional regulator, virulence genes transcriptional regulator